MKKALKIIGVILAILIVLLIAAPFLFKGNLEKALKNAINKNLNAVVAWEHLDLTVFRSFPDASLNLSGFSIINKSPFQGDTLVSGKNLSLQMGITQIFKSRDLKIDGIRLENALINIKVDSLGNANYDIALKDDSIENLAHSTEEKAFTFQLKDYEITDSQLNYFDDASKTFFVLTDIQHKGSGDLSQEVSQLNTKTSALISFKKDSTEYLTKNKLSLDAVFKIDLKNQTYTFLENEARINDLPLKFDGFVKLNEENTEVDIVFSTPSSDFKNFLAVIPEAYLEKISDVKTTGDFTVNGKLKGVVDDTHIPTMDIQVSSDNASFQYPSLPKSVDNITIDAQLKNETGELKDTYLNIPKLTFRIDGEPFRVNGDIKNIVENPLVNMEMVGILNLANIKQVLPITMEQNLTGIFKADILARFDLESVEKERYDKMDVRGNASISNFIYDAGFKNDLKISNASLSLQPGVFSLKELTATTGNTDIKASGTINNLISFLMNKQVLKGHFGVKSNTFDVNDFMASSEDSQKIETSKNEGNKNKSSNEESVKIPSFLDAILDFNANRILYGDLELKNAKGTATIKDETLSLSNFTSDIFGGSIVFSGKVSTKSETPTFSMDLDLNKIDITQSFSKVEMFKYLAPIAKALHGSLNTKFKLSGDLTKDLSPNLASLDGSALAQILTAEVDPAQAPLLSALGDKVSFLDLDRLSLKNVTTNFSFDDGKITVKPFNFDIKGVKINVAGTHSLDKSIDYKLDLDIPAKYLGAEVTKLLQKLDPKESSEMRVDLPVGLTGTFTNPKISLDTEKAVTELTQKLVAKQKDELVNKGTDILEGLLDGVIKKDSTKTNNQQQNNQQNTQQPAKDKVKDILEGFLGGKKKKP